MTREALTYSRNEGIRLGLHTLTFAHFGAGSQEQCRLVVAPPVLIPYNGLDATLRDIETPRQQSDLLLRIRPWRRG